MIYLDATVAASRFRPFARRRFKIARPAFVFMRSLKPCLRRRLIRLGWYVRFIAADPHSRLFYFSAISLLRFAGRDCERLAGRFAVSSTSPLPSLCRCSGDRSSEAILHGIRIGKLTRALSRLSTNRAGLRKRESLPGSLRGCQCIEFKTVRPFWLLLIHFGHPTCDRSVKLVLLCGQKRGFFI